MTQAARSSGRGAYHDDFRLSITKALGDQLAVALDGLGRAPLTGVSLAALDERPGVYQLYFMGDFVYVGKADRTLPGRLRNHLRKLSGRRAIELSDVTFSCLYVDEDFSALAPEKLLISHYKEKGGIPWNNNGFGNNDPGRRRDATILKQNHFDAMYQIDLGRPVEGVVVGDHSLHEFLKMLKGGLPYVFRYMDPPMSQLVTVNVPKVHLSADEAFRIVAEATPEPWQITALMGYVIMYPESPAEYKSACRYYRSGSVIEDSPSYSCEELTDEDKTGSAE
ncbi:restriction endonuclease [Amycolatopsis sp. WAC 01375]|uniref:GIY-YIG nuclease family protein n=1 Tax=Amycolatopsis sp. WAC 01375 TaxID=2203194 RepID=UPI000F7B253E|nr:GIY-YIG nuclease family protein [Amycolatopsis sp. WAC 01375]RSM81365.1 restriction endonuclease [Amycolatopsis sp. WAC 01375]